MIPRPKMVTAGLAVVEAAASRRLVARLLGGVAIWVRGTDDARRALGRDYADFDLIVHRNDGRALRSLLEELGFVPNQLFNAMHGASRLIYHAADESHHVDIFLDRFEMSHKFNFRDRLEVHEDTLPAAELLLTKLQVAELNRKDVSDTALLLWSHELAESDDKGAVDLRVVTGACADDWGLYTTATDNLETILSLLGELPMPGAARDLVRARCIALRDALQSSPKSVRWKMRARIGRRVQWYEHVEEVLR